MRTTIGAAVVGIVLAGSASDIASAGELITKCELTVEHFTYVKGPCEFEGIGGGDFIIRSGDYFAYVYVSELPAVGFWNGIEKASHAHEPLGELSRNGACWANTHTRVCAAR